MDTMSLADAKARFSEVVDRVLAGEPVQITRHGKPVVQITAVVTPRQPVDLGALRRLTDSMPKQAETAEDFVRRMRDEERY